MDLHRIEAMIRSAVRTASGAETLLLTAPAGADAVWGDAPRVDVPDEALQDDPTDPDRPWV
jgi:hypothetical protein